MSVAADQEKLPEKAPDGAMDSRNFSIAVEALFAFAFKGAKRLLEISPDETEVLKRLGVEFMAAKECDRGEILETMLEIMLPEERIGGIGKGRPTFTVAVKERLRSARQYIGGQIRELRERHGWTQVQLARKARIPQSHVSRLERGHLAPTRKTIERLAKVLKVAPDQLDPGYQEAT